MTAYLLNLLDLFLTLYALNHGGTELNPLMRSVPVMVAWKVCGVGVLCWWLQRVSNTDYAIPNTESVLARRGLNLCTVVYTVLFLYHLYFILGGI